MRSDLFEGTEVERAGDRYLRIGANHLFHLAFGEGDGDTSESESSPLTENGSESTHVELVVGSDDCLDSGVPGLSMYRLWASYLLVIAPKIHTLVVTFSDERLRVSYEELVGLFQIPALMKQLQVCQTLSGSEKVGTAACGLVRVSAACVSGGG